MSYNYCSGYSPVYYEDVEASVRIEINITAAELTFKVQKVFVTYTFSLHILWHK